MWRAPLTKRLCGESHRVCGAGRSCDCRPAVTVTTGASSRNCRRSAGRSTSSRWAMDFRSPAPSSARLRWRGSRPCRRECPVVVDGLALGALPEAAEKIARRAPLVALVHHPLALETGLSPADAQKLFESERKALAAARSVIVTSRATGEAAERGLRRSAGAHHRRAAGHRPRQRPPRAASTALCGFCRSGRSCRARASTF